MLVLGVADGPDGSVALVHDDAVVAWVSEARLEGAHLAPGVPWRAIDEALRLAGASASDVDLVAVAGRFSPPLPLRRRPWLRRLVPSPFSPWYEVEIFWQAVLRHSGLGAHQADVAAEWLESRFLRHGFAPRRVLTVDVHQSLAEAAYRLQPRDEALVIGLHPMGDGVAVSVHVGRGGQLDRVYVQRGFASLHVHWMRMVASLGLRPGVDERRFDALAARGTPDPALVASLQTHLHADGPRLSRANYPWPQRASDPVYEALRAAPTEVAAASLLANLTGTVTGVVRHHVRARHIAHVVLAGELFELPRLVAAVSELEEVASVSVLPSTAREALSLGAAVAHAGLAPRAVDLRLGPPVAPEAVTRALQRARLGSVRKAQLADVLFRGGAVLRFRGRAGPGPIGLGERCVLVRADDPVAIRRVRDRLGLSEEVDPVLLTVPTPNEDRPRRFDQARQPLRWGAIAPRVGDAFKRRYGAAVAPDGRAALMRVEEADHPGLHQVLKAVLRGSGCGALAAFPIAEGDGPAVGDPGHALEVWRRAGFDAMQLGDHYVERPA